MKIRYVLGLLQGKALAWVEAYQSANPLNNVSFEDFVAIIKSVFDHPDYTGDAYGRLLHLK